MTGGPTGTYIQFGRDMQNLMLGCGQTMGGVKSAVICQVVKDVFNKL